MQQYIFQNGLLIVIVVYGTMTLTVIDAVIGMVMEVVIMELILGQLVVLSVEVDELSWTLETVFFLKELTLTDFRLKCVIIITSKSEFL